VGETLGEIVERRQRRHQHLPACCHPLQESRLAMERQPVLDRVHPLLDRDARTVQTFGMGCHSQAETARLVHDGCQFLAGHLRRLGVLALDRACPGRHQLDVVGAAAQLLAHRTPHLPGAVRLLVHRPEQAAARGGRRDDPAARDDPRAIEEAELDGTSEHDRLVIEGADVAHRREAVLEQRARRVREHEPAELARARILAVQLGRRPEAGAPGRVRHQVNVRIDEAGQHRAPADVDRAGRRVAGGLGDLDDPPGRSDNGCVLEHASARRVDRAGVPQAQLRAHRRRILPHRRFGVGVPADGALPSTDTPRRLT
jgi:hypothetical protein